MKQMLILLITLNTSILMAQKKAVLIYVGDPLCSWCYGFSPEISKAKETLSETCDFELVMGGLRPYNTETMADLGEFLKGHWEHVSERSDVDFNYEILKDKSFVYDTEPPARSVVVVRALKPSAEFEFFKAVQKVFYSDNKNTNDIQTYLDLLPRFGIEDDAFVKLYNSAEMKEAVRKDFERSAALGVSGFPGTVLKIGEKYYRTSEGFVSAEKLVEHVQVLLKY